MQISSPDDFRRLARKKLPRFLFDYIEGGAQREQTLNSNEHDFQNVLLRQRVLAGSETPDLSSNLFGSPLSLPLALAPVGLTGMYSKRGEVAAAKAANEVGVPFTCSTVSVCSIDEVSRQTKTPPWFQLYVLRDRGFMRHVMERAIEAKIKTLVFTVDMPVPGIRYRDAHSGMSGAHANLRRVYQAIRHPNWAINVGLLGRPHDLGNISAYRGRRTKLNDYIGWLDDNFDPAIRWKDLKWIREAWSGNLIVKGILDAADVAPAIDLGADGIVVSNHGGRQLDGVKSTISALPEIASTVDGRAKILIDSGIRSGLDVVRALCLGADAVMIGRAYIYALASGGGPAVQHLLDLYKKEMQVAMTLIGADTLQDLTTKCLDMDRPPY